MISIIVPVYNVEKYLRPCLDSILAQTYADWEAILVDDGSKDHSGDICDEYAEKDHRFRVIHKENGGVSSARNLGIEECKGEWLTFMDSDDWIELNLLETLSQKISSSRVDCIRWGFFREYIYGQSEVSLTQEKLIENGYENYVISKKGYDAFVWNTLFNKCLLGGIRFDEYINWCEDHIFTTEYLAKCNNVLWLTNSLYHHRVGLGDTLSTNMSPEMMMKASEKLAYQRKILVGDNKKGIELVNYYVISNNFKIIAKLYEISANRKKKRLFFSKVISIYIKSKNPIIKAICYTYNSSIPFSQKNMLLCPLFFAYRCFVKITLALYAIKLKYE